MVDSNFDIVFWVRMIKEGIEKKNLNPWDINIAEIADYYIQKIKELKKFDIRLSADVILVGGILLRMKSEALYDDCNIKEDDEDEYDYEDYYYEEDVEVEKPKKIKKNDNKKTHQNKKIKKPITINDLIRTVERELNKVKKSQSKKKREKKINEIEDIVEVLIEEDDISDIIAELLDDLMKEGIIVYQERFKSKTERVKYFIPSLYLANDGKAELIQEKLFGDLIIKLKL